MLFLACTAAYAVPARSSVIYLKQPDGTVFQARIKGDEFTRIKTDASFRSIIQDAEGWWNYAIYQDDGSKISSGWKVGQEAPADILTSSSRIPYELLATKARSIRSKHAIHEEPVSRRMKNRAGILTRSQEDPEASVKHGLVILAEFKDVKFKHTKEDFERLLTEEGYSVNGATGSAKEYFDAQFKGHMEFDFHVSGIVTLPKDRSHYGQNDSDGNDQAPAEMVADACRLADSQVDFSLYDDDKDGDVDNVFIFFAGQDEAEGASEECLWSHAWYIRSGAGIRLELDNTVIDRYACSSELTIAFDSNGKIHEFINGIGTFCHEYSHTLGLPDFYDTNYEETGGVAAGFWTKTSIMDGGNYNNMGNTPPYYNALERMIAGISEPEILEKTGTYTLSPVNENNESYMLLTDNEEEFFLFECRDDKGWDRYIGGSGMLAYHIDISDGGYEIWMQKNEVNTDPSRQHADLIEADGRTDSFNTMDSYVSHRQNISGIFFPYGSITSIDAGSDNTISSIRKEEARIKFNFLNSETLSPPIAVNIVKDVFADAAIIGFESSYPYEGAATLAYGRPGQEKGTFSVNPYSAGKYAAVLEGLESGGKTYEIEISFATEDIEGEVRSTSIMTKRSPAIGWPYIYLGSIERNDDGSFKSGTRLPLRVYGATDAAEIRWKFNGKTITHDGDGYYTLKGSGTLQAEIQWEDGSVDKIMKQITISL